MAIKVGQESSRATAGIMAYTAGLNRARQRRQKSLTDMLRMDMGQRYKVAMDLKAKEREQFPQAKWEDPLDVAGADQVRINAHRRANDRSRRRGLPIPFPGAEAGVKRGKPKAQIALEKEVAEEGRAAGREQERWRRGAALEQKKHERGVKQRGLDEGEQRTFDFWEERYEDLLAQINEIRKEGPGAWREPKSDKGKKFSKLVRSLDQGPEALDEEGLPARTLDYHRTAAREMGRFLSGFNRDVHLIPTGEREGVVPTAVDIGGVPHIPTNGGIEWKPVPQRKPDLSSADQAGEQVKKRAAYMKYYMEIKGLNVDNPDHLTEAEKAADAVGLTMPAGTPAAAGGGDRGAQSPTFMGLGGGSPPSVETPEENPEVQARAQAIIAELEEKVRAGGPEAEAARIALEKMKPTTVSNPFGF